MNKIQLEAALQLAQMDYDANPNQLNEHKLDQARKAWDQFLGTDIAPAEEKQQEAPKKAAAKAKPKQPKAVVENPVTTDETAALADSDTSAADTEPTEEVEVAEVVNEELEKKTE